MSPALASLYALDAAVKRERIARDAFVQVAVQEGRGNPRVIAAMQELADALQRSADLFAADWERIEPNTRDNPVPEKRHSWLAKLWSAA